jgi:Family of unknown function (DUF5681)
MSEHNNNKANNRRADAAPAPAKTSEPEYKVGPGRPPKEHQFKPGQSGNPKGAKRKPKPMAPDLKAALERALHEPIKLKQGERERTVTMAEAGIKQLVAQFVKGNHQARRDLMVLADKLGVDLMAGQQQALQEGIAANHAAILNAFVDRQYDRVVKRAPVFAPPQLLDDDPQDRSQE